jgi:hypothetical protein
MFFFPLMQPPLFLHTMSQPPVAPNALQGTIADINGKIGKASSCKKK